MVDQRKKWVIGLVLLESHGHSLDFLLMAMQTLMEEVVVLVIVAVVRQQVVAVMGLLAILPLDQVAVVRVMVRMVVHMEILMQLSKLFLGSGGGGGCRDDASCEYPDGANGGGLIYIVASQAVIKGSLKSRGGNSLGGSSRSCDDTIGGPGSGGTIYLRTNSLVVQNPSSAFNVNGGNRAYISQSGINTGTGGMGRVRIDYNTINGQTRGSSGARNEETQFSSVGYWGSF